MVTCKRKHLFVEHIRPDVWVVRFARADLRDQLYDDADVDGTPLFEELTTRVLADLRPGQTVVLNLGLIEQFPTALYRCLLRVRALVAERHARLILCRLSPEHEEIFELFQGHQLFQVTTTESRAIHEAAGLGKCAGMRPRR